MFLRELDNLPWLSKLNEDLRLKGLIEGQPDYNKFVGDFQDEISKITDEAGVTSFLAKADPDIWRKFVNCDQWVRKNTDLFDKVKNRPDLTEDLVRYYSIAMKRSTPSGFNGAGVYDGVSFNKYGHPELHSHVSSPNHIVEIDMKGNYTTDFTDAKNQLLTKLNTGETVEKLNLEGSWSPFYIVRNEVREGPYTWHHHQDGNSMYPVKKEIHDKIIGKHSGGREIILSYPLLKGLFNDR